jgi:hypothetical protein
MTAVYQAVEKRPDSAAKDGCHDGASAQAIDSSRASPGVYRTGDLTAPACAGANSAAGREAASRKDAASQNDLDGRFSTHGS